jgi:hypothetical protein
VEAEIVEVTEVKPVRAGVALEELILEGLIAPGKGIQVDINGQMPVDGRVFRT